MANPVSLSDIRKQYPQYSDMSDTQLADALYNKFYSDLPRDQFNQRIGLQLEKPLAADSAKPLNTDVLQTRNPVGTFGQRGEKALSNYIDRTGNPQTGRDYTLLGNLGFNAIKNQLSEGDFSGAARSATNLVSTVPRGLDDSVRQIAQGATFGYADEIASGADAALQSGTGNGSFQENYDRNIVNERARDDAFAKANPGGAVGLQALGAIANPISRTGAGFVAKGSNALSRFGRGFLVGTGEGAAYGSGTGEGEAGRLTNAGIGAVFGGGAAAGLPILGSLGKSAGRVIFGESRDAGKAAQRIVRDSLRKDGVSVEDVARRLQQSQVDQVPSAVLDVGGDATRRLARTAYSSGDEAGSKLDDFLTQRATEQYDRVINVINRNISGADYRGSLNQLANERKALAKPLYDRAYSAVSPGEVNTPVIQQVLQTPAGRDALKRANRIAFNENQKLPKGLSFKRLDYVKRGLDDVIDSYRDPISGAIRGEEGRAVVELRNQFVNELDRINPIYAEARKSYAGKTSLIKAQQSGVDAAKKGFTDDAIAAYEALTPSEQEFFKIGLARGFRESAGKGNASGIINNRNVRNRIRAFLGEDSRFEKVLDAERRLSNNDRFIRGGSQTANKQTDLNSLSDNIIESVGRGRGFFDALITPVFARGRGIGPRTAKEIQELLTLQDPNLLAQRLGQPRVNGFLAPNRLTPANSAGVLSGFLDRQ